MPLFRSLCVSHIIVLLSIYNFKRVLEALLEGNIPESLRDVPRSLEGRLLHVVSTFPYAPLYTYIPYLSLSLSLSERFLHH